MGAGQTIGSTIGSTGTLGDALGSRDPVRNPTPPTPVPVPVGGQTFDEPITNILNYKTRTGFLKFLSEIPRPGFMNPLDENYNEFLTMLSVFGPALGIGAATAGSGLLLKKPGILPQVTKPSTDVLSQKC